MGLRRLNPYSTHRPFKSRAGPTAIGIAALRPPPVPMETPAHAQNSTAPAHAQSRSLRP